MDSDIHKRLASAAHKLNTSPLKAADPVKKHTNPRHVTPASARKYWMVGGVILVLLLAIIFIGGKGDRNQNVTSVNSVVPEHIKKSVPFPVYYPDQEKLPVGYVLDKNSFSATEAVVVYSVSYGNGSKIAFTLQKKPSPDELAVFYKNQLSLHNEEETPLGRVAVSALNNQRFLSLPTKSDAWLIITAPIDADPEVLLQIVKSLKQ
ncbi:MAG: hypothetical protein ABWX94_02695 [Candidatus Saccharimonadales bacterium]